MPKIAWMLAGMLMAFTAQAPAVGADSLTSTHESATWSRWKGRVSLAATGPSWSSGAGQFGSGGLHMERASAINSLSLMGDYYFAPSLAGPNSVGGFRATSGVIVGPRSQLSTNQPSTGAVTSLNIGSRLFGQVPHAYTVNAADDTATVPYLGLGYTGLSVRGAWRFNADFGMMTQGLGTAANPGRMFGSGQRRLDESLRDLRLTPLFKLGVSYAF